MRESGHRYPGLRFLGVWTRVLSGVFEEEEMMMRGFRAVLLSAGILAAWAIPAHAQAIGSIFGKVTDASGGVLPGVTVTVTGPALQQPLTAVSSESGTYQFPAVPIGTFTVTFELASFK